MAVVFFEGFDTASIADYRQIYTFTNTVPSLITGYSGSGKAISMSGWPSQSFTSIALPAISGSTYYVGFHVISVGTNGPWFQLVTPSTTVVYLSGTNGSPLTVNGNSTTGTMTGSGQSVVVKLTIDPSVGEITVHLDGVSVYSATGINTGSTMLSALQFQGSYFAGGPSTQVDDIWVFDTSGSHSNAFPIGDIQVQPLYPTTDVLTQWSTSSGSTHYNLVNETPADDDTSYVYASTIGDKDSYDVGSISGAVSQVHAVKATVMPKKDGIPAKVLHSFITSGSTTSESSDILATNGYAITDTIWSDDPNTSAQWTVTDVDATEVGIKVIS